MRAGISENMFNFCFTNMANHEKKNPLNLNHPLQSLIINSYQNINYSAALLKA